MATMELFTGYTNHFSFITSLEPAANIASIELENLGVSGLVLRVVGGQFL